MDKVKQFILRLFPEIYIIPKKINTYILDAYYIQTGNTLEGSGIGMLETKAGNIHIVRGSNIVGMIDTLYIDESNTINYVLIVPEKINDFQYMLSKDRIDLIYRICKYIIEIVFAYDISSSNKNNKLYTVLTNAHIPLTLEVCISIGEPYIEIKEYFVNLSNIDEDGFNRMMDSEYEVLVNRMGLYDILKK